MQADHGPAPAGHLPQSACAALLPGWQPEARLAAGSVPPTASQPTSGQGKPRVRTSVCGGRMLWSTLCGLYHVWDISWQGASYSIVTNIRCVGNHILMCSQLSQSMLRSTVLGCLTSPGRVQRRSVGSDGVSGCLLQHCLRDEAVVRPCCNGQAMEWKHVSMSVCSRPCCWWENACSEMAT